MWRKLPDSEQRESVDSFHISGCHGFFLTFLGPDDLFCPPQTQSVARLRGMCKKASQSRRTGFKQCAVRIISSAAQSHDSTRCDTNKRAFAARTCRKACNRLAVDTSKCDGTTANNADEVSTIADRSGSRFRLG